MGAFRYCGCGAGLDKPTPRDDLTFGQVCGQCGRNQPQYMTVEEWVIDLFDELTDLKSKLPSD